MFSKQFTATVSLIFASLIWGTAFVAQTTGMDFIGPLTFKKALIFDKLVSLLNVKEFLQITSFRFNSTPIDSSGALPFHLISGFN